MQIEVNGRPHVCEGSAVTVTSLLEQLGYKNHFVAVAINKDCIPRTSFSERVLQEKDAVEILAPMAGG